ncbi:MAG: zinc-ribbon domain containing protein [Chloroflexota bacterium]|nr:zinc-ribbon domain containing protein [Chloroflexota bacterium]
MAYTDKVITCADCGIDFVFSASEQEFFAQKGFASAPKRCVSCRAQRRATQGGSGYGNGAGAGGYSDTSSYGGGGGGYGASSYGGGGYSRAPREMFDATCARCGKDTQVPFRPSGARPVYCSDCFRLVRS